MDDAEQTDGLNQRLEVGALEAVVRINLIDWHHAHRERCRPGCQEVDIVAVGAHAVSTGKSFSVGTKSGLELNNGQFVAARRGIDGRGAALGAGIGRIGHVDCLREVGNVVCVSDSAYIRVGNVPANAPIP
jgi:hypothetical protein